MTDLLLQLNTPEEIARKLAERARALRLSRNWTQQTLANRAGVTLASLRRFESSALASLELVLRISHALGRTDEFDALLLANRHERLEDLEQHAETSRRKRGRL